MKRKTVVKFLAPEINDDGIIYIPKEIIERDYTEEEIKEEKEREEFNKLSLDNSFKFGFEFCFTEEQMMLPEEDLIKVVDKSLEPVRELLLVQVLLHPGRR